MMGDDDDDFFMLVVMAVVLTLFAVEGGYDSPQEVRILWYHGCWRLWRRHTSCCLFADVAVAVAADVIFIFIYFSPSSFCCRCQKVCRVDGGVELLSVHGRGD